MENRKHAVEQAMDATLAGVAAFKGEEACQYLASLITAAVSLLRSADDGLFVYSFLQAALASLSKSATVVPNPYGGDLGLALHKADSMASPESLNSVEDLRRELRLANEQLIERDIRLTDNESVLKTIAKDLGKLLIAHLQKDAEQVHQLLDAFCRDHVVIKHNGSSAIH